MLPIMRITSLTIFLFLVFTYSADSQNAKEILEIANSGNIDSSNFLKEIKFEDKYGYFIIPVTIGNVTYNYIFDTGGYNTINTSILERNKLRELIQVEVGSSNQIKSKVAMSRVPNIQIAGISFRNVGVFNFDFEKSQAINCYTNGGIIGKGIIKESVWQIDYRNGLIRLTDKLSELPNLDNAIKLKVRLDKTFNPFIKAEVNGKKIEFMLDYGFGGFISLTENTAKKILKSSIQEIDGEGTIGANGMSEDHIFYGPIKSLEVGKKTFDNQIAYFSKPNNYNLIGSEISKYFIVTLNFREEELYLTPYADTVEEKYETFGFALNMNESGVYVSKLHSNSNAKELGLRLDDKVSMINGIDPTLMDYCDFYFLVKNLLKSKDEINLVINRTEGKAGITIGKESILDK